MTPSSSAISADPTHSHDDCRPDKNLDFMFPSCSLILIWSSGFEASLSAVLVVGFDSDLFVANGAAPALPPVEC